MKQYISKDTIVVEIDNMESSAICEFKSNKSRYTEGVLDTIHRIKSILDTIEVKEVDLEKYYHDFLQKEWFGKNCVRTFSEMMAFTAKYFFELGMQVSNKAQKGE